jgi:hypothetical protein
MDELTAAVAGKVPSGWAKFGAEKFDKDYLLLMTI